MDSSSDDEDTPSYMSIKLTLSSILNPTYKELLKNLITERVLKCTKICAIASTYVLFKINKAYDDRRFDFFRGDVSVFVSTSFYSILEPYIIEGNDEEFARNYHGNWPTNSYMGNTFKYLIEQYETNLMNTVRVHRENNVRKFLKMKVYEYNQEVPAEMKITAANIKSIIHLVFRGVGCVDGIYFNII